MKNVNKKKIGQAQMGSLDSLQSDRILRHLILLSYPFQGEGRDESHTIAYEGGRFKILEKSTRWRYLDLVLFS